MKGRNSHWLTVIVALVVVAAMVAGCGPKPTEAPPPPEAPAEATDLTFVVWSYGLETIQDNIKKLEEKHPDVKVELQDFGWPDYHDTIVSRSVANTPTDLLYGSDHWLQEWADAGWLEPLDTHFPQVKDYMSEMAPYAVQGMTYNGHVYGLPYYADTIIFVYNEEHLKQAGFDEPPATWEELTEQAKAIKEKGIVEYPLTLAFSQKEGASIEAFIGMV
jgi:multiple sugar transport system substrate-binding protein